MKKFHFNLDQNAILQRKKENRFLFANSSNEKFNQLVFFFYSMCSGDHCIVEIVERAESLTEQFDCGELRLVKDHCRLDVHIGEARVRCARIDKHKRSRMQPIVNTGAILTRIAISHETNLCRRSSNVMNSNTKKLGTRRYINYYCSNCVYLWHITKTNKNNTTYPTLHDEQSFKKQMKINNKFAQIIFFSKKCHKVRYRFRYKRI